MTKKEIYAIALEASRAALRTYFDDPIGFKNESLQKRPHGKVIVKAVFDKIESMLPKDTATTTEAK